MLGALPRSPDKLAKRKEGRAVGRRVELRSNVPGRQWLGVRGEARRLLSHLRQSTHHVGRVQVEGLCQDDEFNDVQTAFAAFGLRDKGLRFLEKSAGLTLGEAGLLARVHKNLAEGLMPVGSERLEH